MRTTGTPVSLAGFEMEGEEVEEASEMEFVVEPEGVIICRPTPAILLIKGLRANAPGARIYASAYSPEPRCLKSV